MSKIREDFTGRKYGRLTVINMSHKDKKGKYYWNCICECGNTAVVVGAHLKSGNTKSCGCLFREFRKKHGGDGTKLYSVWKNMRYRCRCKTAPYYDDYGGRGIDICKEWGKYNAFREWAVHNGYREGLTIDRIDNDDGYNPSNCQWVTIKEQSRNKRTTRLVTINGKTLCLTDWAKLLGISKNTLRYRLRDIL